MKHLPFVLSIPHGGDETPPELAGRVCLAPADLLDDADAFTRELYDAGERVCQVIRADVARAFVDLNRGPDQRPPEFPDGVVKSATCYARPIYHRGSEPDAALTETLLDLYYHPYHRALEEAMRDPEVVLGIDCHTMAAEPPAVAPDKSPRPLVNLGDADGTACDPAWTRWMQEAFIQEFDFPEEQVVINKPFKGGYITRRHGNHPRPWIQVELNRSLYLAEPWFDRPSGRMNPERIRELRQRFIGVLGRFSRRIGQPASNTH